jgi:hypothetical protein
LGANFAPPSFYKDTDGRVHLAGTAVSTVGSGGDGACGGPDESNEDAVVFLLPPSHRPAANELFFTRSEGGFGAAILATDTAFGSGESVPAGSVVVAGSLPGLAGLSGVSFRAASPAAARANAKGPAMKAPPGLKLAD